MEGYKFKGTSLHVCKVGLPRIVVFMNKCDMADDEELLELVEMEVVIHLDFNGPLAASHQNRLRPTGS